MPWIAFGVALVTMAALSAVCALAGLTDGADDSLIFAGYALLLAPPGVLAVRSFRLTPRPRATELFLASVVGFATLAVVGALPYVLTGAITRLDIALFEAVSGVTTSSATVVNPEVMSRATLLWRSQIQFVGGAAFLTMALWVLPVVGVGGLRSNTPGMAGARSLRQTLRAVQSLTLLYGLLNAATAVAYLAAGMPWFDSIAHAMTTVSTGGMSTRTAGLASYGSSAIETIAIVAMATAGLSLPLLGRMIRKRQVDFAWNSVEFRVYTLLLVLPTAWIWWSNSVDTGYSLDALRSSAFAVTSSLTTTGFVLPDATGLNDASLVVLFALIVIGAMSASPSGGFTVYRTVVVYAYVQSVLRKELHPRSVQVVKIGFRRLSDSEVNRVIGSIMLAVIGASLALVVVGSKTASVADAVSIVVTSLSNAGPSLETQTRWPIDLGVLGRGVIALTMLFGRMDIYPLAGALGDRPGQAMRALGGRARAFGAARSSDARR